MAVRRSLVIVAGVVAALLALAVVGYWLLDPNVFRERVEHELSSRLGQRVTIGHLAATLFPTPAVTGTDVRVEGVDPGRAPAVSMRAIRILPAWRTLLSHPIVVDAVELQGLAITLRRDAEGRWILPGAGTTPPGTGASGGGAAVPGLPGAAESAAVAIRRVRVRDGRVIVADPSATMVVLDRIDADLSERSGGTGSLTLRGVLGHSAITGLVESGPQGLAAAVQAPSLESRDLPAFFALVGSAVPPDLSIAGPAPLDLKIAIARDTGALTASGLLRIDRLRFGSLSATKVAAPFRIANETVSIEPLSLGAYGGAGRSVLRVRYGQPRTPWTLDAEVNDFDVNALLSATTSARDRLLGKGRMTARVHGTAESPAARHLAGPLDLVVSNGVIRDFRLLAAINSALRITGGSGDDTRFERLSATLDVANGVLHTSNVLLSAGELTVRAAGTMTFEHALDMKGIATFSREASGRMIASVKEVSGAKNEQGEVEVPFAISGSTDQPVFRIEVEQILGRAVQKEIQRNIRRRLGDLFKKP
jgi:uncharacterized protein involved in outer membrane biogenesis